MRVAAAGGSRTLETRGPASLSRMMKINISTLYTRPPLHRDRVSRRCQGVVVAVVWKVGRSSIEQSREAAHLPLRLRINSAGAGATHAEKAQNAACASRERESARDMIRAASTWVGRTLASRGKMHTEGTWGLECIYDNSSCPLVNSLGAARLLFFSAVEGFTECGWQGRDDAFEVKIRTHMHARRMQLYSNRVRK